MLFFEEDLIVIGPCKGGVTVWFFGTYEMGCIKRSEVMGFEAGLEQELHTKCKRSVKTFRRALHEAYIYLQVCCTTLKGFICASCCHVACHF